MVWLRTGLLLVSCLCLVAAPGFAQDVLWGLTRYLGPQGGGTAFSVQTTGADFTVRKAFEDAPMMPFGSLVEGRDGNFYGVSQYQHGWSYYAITYGSVFRMSPAGEITVLKVFSYSDGAYPVGDLVEGRDGNFYGMTSMGGNNGAGTVYKISPAGAFATLKSFDYANGADPRGSLVQGSDGNFYGMTSGGGSSGAGTVFRISPAGAFTLLKSFGYADGAYPMGSLVQGRDGDFYGMTSGGGSSDVGTVFKMSATGALTTLDNFDYANGAYPQGSLVEGRDGDFYGMASQGGPYGSGTVIRISPTGTLAVLKSFSFALDYVDGAEPVGNLVEGRDGDFYGMTYRGGSNGLGTIFKISPAGTATVLRSLTENIDGAYPLGSLVQGPDGDFYGMTHIGGNVPFRGFGTVFKISPEGSFTVINAFGYSNGTYPDASLVKAHDGNFYGITQQGGSNNRGTFFKISPAGTHIVLNSINYPGGDWSPFRRASECGLVEGRDGNFYGMTQEGGSSYGGTVFKITPTGTLTVLKNFNRSDGSYPVGSLVEGRDGNFYSVTQQGGSGGGGTVFKISPTGTFTVLKEFSVAEGADPMGGLVLGVDGDFYGMTSRGGVNGGGMVFKISPAGAFTVLKEFTIEDGASPAGGLTLGRDGDFYGLTSWGGSGHAGTFFKISPAGTYTVLIAFYYYDFYDFHGSLVEGSDGDFYGITYMGGDNGLGAIFKISPATGMRTIVKSFTEADGFIPTSSLIIEKQECTPPVLTLPANITVDNGPEICGANVTFAASASGTPAPCITYKVGDEAIASPHYFPVGTTTVTALAVNGCGRVTKNFTVTVLDKTPPMPQLTALPDLTGECAVKITEAPQAGDYCGEYITATTTDPLEYTAQGTYTVTWTYRDANGNTATQTQKVMVKDVTSPAVTAPASLTLSNDAGQCGRALANISLGTPVTADNCGVVKAATHDAPAFFPAGTTTVTWTVEDAAGNRSTATQLVTIANADPVVGALAAPVAPVAINTPVSASAAFRDNNLTAATWDWGTGTTAGTIDQANGKITGSRTYGTPGVHTVTLTVTDACGKTASSSFRYVVVYDPNGGFVTGGGWIHSPANAYAADPAATGTAHFGFVSRYQKGATQPVGNTNFAFKAAGLEFNSTSYEWLVVSGPQAQFKGAGTLNGEPGYIFILTAGDGQVNGGVDRFRIKIWKEGETVPAYDNQRGAADHAGATTAIRGGSIMVHDDRSKARENAEVRAEAPVAAATLRGFPNPFAGKTTIEFAFGREEAYSLAVYDLNGRLVAALGAATAEAGKVNRVVWETKTAPAGGMYVARLTTRSGVQHVKLVLR